MLAAATAAASAAELAYGQFFQDGNIHDVGDHRGPIHSVYFLQDHAQYVPAIALSLNARHQISKRSPSFGAKGAIKFGGKFTKKAFKKGPFIGKKGIKKSPFFAKKGIN